MVKNNKAPDLENLRKRLKDDLPNRIGKALTDYEAFHTAEPPADAKGFSAHQAACRSALAHMEMLTKLLRWAEGDEGVSGPEDGENIGALIARAKVAIGRDLEDEGEGS